MASRFLHLLSEERLDPEAVSNRLSLSVTDHDLVRRRPHASRTRNHVAWVALQQSMSAQCQSRKSGNAITTSALAPTTDIPESGCDVRKAPPEADVVSRSTRHAVWLSCAPLPFDSPSGPVNLHAFIIRVLNLPLIGSSSAALDQVARATSRLGNVTTREGSSRADTVTKGIGQPHLHLFHSPSVLVLESTAAVRHPR
ncbi:hypothetical protein V1282_007027 [Nitrobacteraceae bacterium AZCC 2146]